MGPHGLQIESYSYILEETKTVYHGTSCPMHFLAFIFSTIDQDGESRSRVFSISEKDLRLGTLPRC